MAQYRWVCSIWVALCAGCGSDVEETGSAEPIPLERLPARLAAALCSKAYDCCSTEEIARDRLASPSESDCNTNGTAVYALLVAGVVASEELGRVRYDAKGMAGCVAELEQSTCATIDLSRCREGLVPLVPLGGVCGDNYECVEGNCIGGAGADIEGTCGPPLADGTPCGSDFDCQSGHCDAISGACATQGAAGAACSRDDECESGWCGDDGTCGAETVCPL